MAILSLVGGIFLLDEFGVIGTPGVAGGVLISVGAALFDALDEGRLGSRQAGILLLLVGLGITTWALLVILLTHQFLEEVASPVLYAMLTGGIAALLAGGRLRRAGPAPDLAWGVAAAREGSAIGGRTEAA